MSQIVFAKQYDCLTCHEPIRLSKIDDPKSKKKWLKFEMDGKTQHQCSKKQQEGEEEEPQQQQLPKSNNNNNDDKEQQQQNLATEINQLREQNKELRALVGLTRQDVRSLVAQVQLLRKEFGQAFAVTEKND